MPDTPLAHVTASIHSPSKKNHRFPMLLRQQATGWRRPPGSRVPHGRSGLRRPLSLFPFEEIERRCFPPGRGRRSTPSWRACASRRGIPRSGFELTEAVLPDEAGLRERGFISTPKGCYLGQGTVARMKTYRHVNGMLGAPVLEGDAPESGSEISFEGEGGRGDERRPRCGIRMAIALGYVRRERAAPGTRLLVRTREATARRPFRRRRCLSPGRAHARTAGRSPPSRRPGCFGTFPVLGKLALAQTPRWCSRRCARSPAPSSSRSSRGSSRRRRRPPRARPPHASRPVAVRHRREPDPVRERTRPHAATNATLCTATTPSSRWSSPRCPGGAALLCGGSGVPIALAGLTLLDVTHSHFSDRTLAGILLILTDALSVSGLPRSLPRRSPAVGRLSCRLRSSLCRPADPLSPCPTARPSGRVR